MAANKFATMLHRNTHKITVILVYAVLEWVLIIFLLLNSLFSYLITKFATFFGLKPPCLWCCRVDHFLEPGKNTNSYTDLVCETHATEISKLGYCLDHRKLAELQNMCEDCSSSRPNYNDKSMDISRKIAFFSWVSESRIENGEKNVNCSCCDESLSSKLYTPYLLFKHPWGVLDYTQKGNLITQAIDVDNNGGEYSDPCKSDCAADHCDYDCEIKQKRGEEEDDAEGLEGHQILSDVESFSFREAADEDCSRSVSNFQCDEKEGNEDEKAGNIKNTMQDYNGTDIVHQFFDDTMIQICYRDESIEIINLHSKNYINGDFNRLIPVELIDASTTANQRLCKFSKEDVGKHDHQDATFDSESQTETLVESFEETKRISGDPAPLMMDEKAVKTRCAELESLEMGEIENSSVLNVKEGKEDLVGKPCEQVTTTQAAKTPSTDANIVEAEALKDPDDPPATKEEGFKFLGDETKSEILIATEVFDHEQDGQVQVQVQEPIPLLPCLQVDRSSMHNNNVGISRDCDAFIAENDQGPKQIEKVSIQETTILADKNQEGINHYLSLRTGPTEVDEEKLPETPTYMEGQHHLHKKLLLFEKRESGAEESLDGSVVSEMEGGDGVLTIEQLKSAVKAERKALSALYAELEEERSASAIAANQTMAMITRLQEEKAAMQMEALQYQRMMEEQSEYDQEALQLLNELMLKREKEKQELEKELEIYRKKVLDYEAKDKMMMMRKRKDRSGRSRNSSATCSNAEDSDELSIDLNRETRDEDSSFYGHQESTNNNTPADEVLNLEEMEPDCVKHFSTLDESLEEFEEERLSILEQLKALEEKLFMLGDDEEQVFEDAKPIEHFTEHCGKDFDENYDFSSQEVNGILNGFSDDLSGKHYLERKTIGSKAKSLLPLFDATDIETEDEVLNEQIEYDSVRMQNSSVSKFEPENKKLAIEEEVDHVYERLQALEADREFLKHCISSLKKGDKGMDLLQEILQHLRDLRTVELRVRNMCDGPLV